MLDLTVDMEKLKWSLSPYIDAENGKRIDLHLRLFKQILLKPTTPRHSCNSLLQEGVAALFKNRYWLSLEISAQELPSDDDIVFRRCLHHFAEAVEKGVRRPSVVTVYDTGIDILNWYRESHTLGADIHQALEAWNQCKTVARTTCRSNAQKALQCIRLIKRSNLHISKGLIRDGLSWFGNLERFRRLFADNPIVDKHQKLQSALAGVMQAFNPEKFTPATVQINHKKADVTDLAKICPIIVDQLQTIANMPKYRGERDHVIASITRRFFACISSIRKVSPEFPDEFIEKGLEAFKDSNFQLLTKAEKVLDKRRFTELILLLEDYFGHRIYKHCYRPNLLPFYFATFGKFRTIDYSTIAEKLPDVYSEIKAIHKSETELLAEKNYDMETLHTRFSKLIRMFERFLLPNYAPQLEEYGLVALSENDNTIQKSLFQSIQGEVQAKKISTRTGTSYFEVIRWVMMLTDQPVVEAFKISQKKRQIHARRLRVEDLYTDDELRELAFYVERGIALAANNKQLVALYFARIQLKTCWNTTPMADIELDDIKQISLPTAKKAVNVLIQKPRKGYDIDCYAMDGRTLNSVMRDIQYLRDEITAKFRQEQKNQEVQRYLFIYQEWKEIKRLDPAGISAYISSIIERLGCRITYNSMRIRKNGANHLYREVAKNMRSYQDVKLHSFDTFIKHYQRIEETKTQQNLHDAVSVMQKYFTGREIDPDIKILTEEDYSLQKTPTGECASTGNDREALQYHKEHRKLKTHASQKNSWCSDYLACIWCKHFRTVADAEHVWQLLSYRDYVLTDMSASMSDIDNNDFQRTAFDALQARVNAILEQISFKNRQAVIKGEALLREKGMHPFWSFAITSVNPVDGREL